MSVSRLDAMILAVLDHPDDEVARFVLSDCLEEVGVLRQQDRPERLRLNGWWEISVFSWYLYWAVFPGTSWLRVGRLPRFVACEDCDEQAKVRWPIHALGVKRWMCQRCYNTRVVDGTIHTSDNKERWR